MLSLQLDPLHAHDGSFLPFNIRGTCIGFAEECLSCHRFDDLYSDSQVCCRNFLEYLFAESFPKRLQNTVLACVYLLIGNSFGTRSGIGSFWHVRNGWHRVQQLGRRHLLIHCLHWDHYRGVFNARKQGAQAHSLSIWSFGHYNALVPW